MKLPGSLFENTALGFCSKACQGYLTWKQAIRLVYQSQPVRTAPAAMRLTREIERQLGARVEFFTAVGSALDKFHSVDAFFEIQGTRVTIDVTINPSKTCGKADVIIHADEFENLEKLAARIIRTIAARTRKI